MRTEQRAAQVVALVVIGVCVFVPPVIAQGGDGTAPIDPAVLAELDAKGEATFWVLFREQVDLSPAFEIRDWDQRGRFVYERLVAAAEESQGGVRDLLKTRGADSTSFWIVNTMCVRSGDTALVHSLAARPEVAEILAPPEVQLIDMVPEEERPHTKSVEWNILRIRANEVWTTYGVRGEGIVIGSIDSGVQFDHPALVEQYRGNLGGGVFDHNYNWYDYAVVCGDPSLVPCDSGSHGTWTTGFAVGDDGDTNQIGVAPGARFILAAGFDEAGMPLPLLGETLMASIQWMLAPTDLNNENPRPELRPHVINNSWGSYSGFQFFQSAIQAWVASGIFTVFALGNDGPSCETGLSPGDYPETYAVGAHDINNDITWFSSRGPSVLGPIKPDIVAPGLSVRSSDPIDSYATGYGTSGASPHVAGTVALMWSLNSALIGDIETTRRHLDHAAIDISDLSCGGDPGNNNVWGEGRLDAFDAVSLLFIDGFESGDTSAWSSEVP